MNRLQLLVKLADFIISLERPHPLRVAIDGVDAAGKTTLADELAQVVGARGRLVIRASVDGFHHPRALRYRRGRDSPAGYYHDSFDYEAVCNELLIPLGPGGDRHYRPAVFDWRSDTPLNAPRQLAPPNAVLLFDGIFLLRPELKPYWDYGIFLQVDFEETLRRAVERDRAHLGAAEQVRARYRVRYVPGQMLYLQSVYPQALADVVVDNNDWTNPHLLVKQF